MTFWKPLLSMTFWKVFLLNGKHLKHDLLDLNHLTLNNLEIAYGDSSQHLATQMKGVAYFSSWFCKSRTYFSCEPYYLATYLPYLALFWATSVTSHPRWILEHVYKANLDSDYLLIGMVLRIPIMVPPRIYLDTRVGVNTQVIQDAVPCNMY